MAKTVPKAVQEAKDRVAGITKELGAAPTDAGGGVKVKTTDNIPSPDDKKTLKPGEPIIIGDLPKAQSLEKGAIIKPGEQPGVSPAGADDWQHKYKVLKNKYDKEVFGAQANVRALTQELETQKAIVISLQKTVDALLAMGPAIQGSVVTGDQKRDALHKGEVKALNPDDFEGYGPEMKDFVVAFNSLLEENKGLRTQLDETTKTAQSASSVTAKIEISAEDEFFNAIGKEVPDYRTINAQPSFKQFLAGVDESSGMMRQTVLKNAQQNLNPKPVIRLMKEAMQEVGYVSSPSGDGGRPKGGNGGDSETDDLGQHLVPDTSVGGPSGGPPEFIPVTEKDMEEARMLRIRKKIEPQEWENIVRRFQKTQEMIAKGELRLTP